MIIHRGTSQKDFYLGVLLKSRNSERIWIWTKIWWTHNGTRYSCLKNFNKKENIFFFHNDKIVENEFKTIAGVKVISKKSIKIYKRTNMFIESGTDLKMW